MIDKDNITLPREVAELALDALHYAARPPARDDLYAKEIAILRTALAAEQPVPTDKDSLTVQSRLDAESFREERDEARALLNGVLQDIEALRRDAERWRWHRADIAKHMGRSPESIDAAIEAAMKKDET